MICVVVRGTDCHQLKQFEMACVPASRPGSLATLKKMMDYQLQYASAAIESYRLQTSYLLNLQQLRRRLKSVTNNFSGRSTLSSARVLQLTLFATLASVPCHHVRAPALFLAESDRSVDSLLSRAPHRHSFCISITRWMRFH